MSAGDVAVLWLVQGPKLTDFLLNPEHHKGASRLKYFQSFGYARDGERELADALVAHAVENSPGVFKSQPIGPSRVVFEGTVQAPDGRDMPLRTVWEVGGDDEERIMRFLTAVLLTR